MRSWRHVVALLPLLAIGLLPRAVLGDELELLNGTRVRGTVIEETAEAISMKVTMGSSSAQMKFPMKKVHAITVGGDRRVVNEKVKGETEPLAPAEASGEGSSTDTQPAGKAKAKALSRAEVQALVQQGGSTPPEWWDSVPLDYPKSLDLSWPEKPPQGPWNPQKNVGQYIWSVINENPSRWRSGVRFLHYLLTMHKDNPKTLTRVMESLGNAYFNLLQDWARAAFWWEKAEKREPLSVFNTIRLGECYWHLGNKGMAVEKLNVVKSYLSGGIVKLWSEIGELGKALDVAQAMVRQGERGNSWLAADGHLAAADALRRHGRYQEALSHYAKVLAIPATGQRKGIIERAHKRARDSADAVKVYDALDLKRVPDGTYRATSTAYAGPIEVAVTIAAGRIDAVKVTRYEDKQYYASLTAVPAEIVEKQSVKGIDAVTCATITSEAIVNATAKALAGAMR